MQINKHQLHRSKILTRLIGIIQHRNHPYEKSAQHSTSLSYCFVYTDTHTPPGTRKSSGSIRTICHRTFTTHTHERDRDFSNPPVRTETDRNVELNVA